MNTVKLILNWLNGNKTFFGMIILLFLQQGFIPSEGFLYDFLQWLGNLLAGVGVLHKIGKATKVTKAASLNK